MLNGVRNTLSAEMRFVMLFTVKDIQKLWMPYSTSYYKILKFFIIQILKNLIVANNVWMQPKWFSHFISFALYVLKFIQPTCMHFPLLRMPFIILILGSQSSVISHFSSMQRLYTISPVRIQFNKKL